MSTVAEAPLSDDDLGESPLQLALAREIPGFGGIYYEPGEGRRSEGRLVLAVTEAGVGDLPMAREAVLTAVNRFAPPTADAPEMLDRVVQHTFLEMAEHRARLRPHLFEMDEVVSLSVDEEFNRIKVGVTDLAFASAVEEVAIELGVPEGMLQIVRDSPAEPRTAKPGALPLGGSAAPAPWPYDLTSRIADRRLAGGYEAGATFSPRAPCSIGFTALTKEIPTTKTFVSASHCTLVPFKPDTHDEHGFPSYWVQPWMDGSQTRKGLIGEELLDPHYRRCGFLWLGKCRNADAALMAVDLDSADIALGKIARTRRDQWMGCNLNCETRIDTEKPTFEIVGERWGLLDNLWLEKVGKRTGWTFGYTTDTCVEIKGTDGVRVGCSDKLKAVVAWR